MDLNDVRITWTVVSFLVFLAIVAWAYSRGARRGFDEAAQLPFLDETRPGNRPTQSGGSAR
jgi:cytochrome c oxidase cbb3-type subunit 4